MEPHRAVAGDPARLAQPHAGRRSRAPHPRGSAGRLSMADILLERADKVLAANGGCNCKRVLTPVEIESIIGWG